MRSFFLSLTLLLFTIFVHAKDFSLIITLSNVTGHEEIINYITCLEKNLDNPLIADIHIIYDTSHDDTQNKLFKYLEQRPVTIHRHSGNPTYGDCFAVAQKSKCKAAIIADNDIYCNDTLHALENVDLKKKLVRVTPESEDSGQGAWIFQVPMPPLLNDAIYLESPYAHERFAVQTVGAGLELVKTFPTMSCVSIVKRQAPSDQKKMKEFLRWSELQAGPSGARPHKKKLELWDKLLPVTNTVNALCFMNGRDKSNYSLTLPFLMLIAKISSAKIFIETGTQYAETTLRAARAFWEIHSIEIDPGWAQSATAKCTEKQHIKIYEGDSPAILKKILPPITEKTVLFLDAQASVKSSVSLSVNNPLFDELQAIKIATFTPPFIIVDDARLFYAPLCNVQKSVLDGYCALSEVVRKILTISDQYRFACVQDMLIAYTDDIVVSPVVHACTVSRLYDETNFEISQILQAEKTISAAVGLEKDTLKELALYYTESWGAAAGLSRHYPYWYGLILFEQKDFKNAITQFQEAINRGLNHWRVKWHLACAQSEVSN